MKRPVILLGLAVTAFGGVLLAQESPEDVREFRSKSGTRMKAMVVGIDPSGKVLLQRYAPSAVSLKSLSPEDQAYVREWQERHAKEQEFIRDGWLNERYRDPGITILKGTMRTLEDGKWKPYEPANVENLRYVAYYFTKEWEEDRFIKSVSDTYKKLRKRYDTVEVVYLTLGKSDEAVRNYIEEKDVEFPVLDPSASGLLRTDAVGALFKGTYPQLVVVDRQANVKADSFVGKNEASTFSETLEAFEKLARDAAREQKATTENP